MCNIFFEQELLLARVAVTDPEDYLTCPSSPTVAHSRAGSSRQQLHLLEVACLTARPRLDVRLYLTAWSGAVVMLQCFGERSDA
jgi:hypothetical protein